jgi:hypothetical protein
MTTIPKHQNNKISAAKLLKNPMKAKQRPEEVKQKLRAANLGQKRTAQTKHNISLGLKKK